MNADPNADPDADPDDDDDDGGASEGSKAAQYAFMLSVVIGSKHRGIKAGRVLALMRQKFGLKHCVSQATVYRWLKKATCDRGRAPGTPELYFRADHYFGPGYFR